MRWMINTQLGRRNLSPIQRIAIAEKYRPIYEKQAKKDRLLQQMVLILSLHKILWKLIKIRNAPKMKQMQTLLK